MFVTDLLNFNASPKAFPPSSQISLHPKFNSVTAHCGNLSSSTNEITPASRMPTNVRKIPFLTVSIKV